MCGIFGIHFFDSGRQVDKQMLMDSTNTMLHRGPDDCDFFMDNNIGLGHRRLSIIDLAAGHQPMFSEDRSVAVVYNGEIYNYLELREILVGKGHKFQTKSDTETIIHAYEEWGETCVEKFRGIFAFAIWDNNEKILLLARDRLGVKPLYYYNDKNVFLFASEIKAILKTEFVEKAVNLPVLDAYFTLGYIPGQETLFKNIYKLLPGHTITIREDQLSCRKYWDFPIAANNTGSFKQAQEEFLYHFSEAVNMRLMSEVPLGVFLSGGLDSSAVVAMMHQVVDRPIKTFSIGYKNADNINELNYAQLIADKFNTEHYPFILEPDNFLDSMQTFLHFMEEPVVESAGIALYNIAKMSKQHVTVVLSGEGSDEAFGGYNLYYLMNRLASLRGKIPLLNFFSKLIPPQLFSTEKLRKYRDWFFLPLNKSYRGTSADLTESFKKPFYTDAFYNERGNYLDTIFESHFNRVAKQNTLSKMLYVDAKTWLVDDLLLKADKMSMAASIELRVPFLDHVLIEFAAKLPPDFKIGNDQGKFILKKSMENFLPHEIIYRKKMGFPVPVNQWFGKDLHEQAKNILLDSKSIQRGYIKPDYIKKIFAQQKTGNAGYGRRIFSLLTLEMWFRMWLDG